MDDFGLPWTVTGTVVAPALSPRRLRVAAGTFRAVDSALPGMRGFRARYELRLLSDDGERFTLTGTKEIHAPRAISPLALWRESTTLSAVVHREPTGEVVAAGVASISMPDLARQLASVRMSPPVLSARVTPPRRAVAPLGRHRPLRLPPPESRWCAGDGRWHAGDRIGPDAWLRLIRYRGGDRGPVMLAAGFSMSATSFLVDTVSTNLVEHLAGEGFDVWLFDYRAGIDLPSARADFTIDDIATRDWPAAVAEVRRVSGADTVQALGHCVGSATLMMALAAGLGGVRSAICMQTTLHPVASTLNLAKATLPVSRLVRALGGRRVARRGAGPSPRSSPARSTGRSPRRRTSDAARRSAAGSTPCTARPTGTRSSTTRPTRHWTTSSTSATSPRSSTSAGSCAVGPPSTRPARTATCAIRSA